MSCSFELWLPLDQLQLIKPCAECIQVRRVRPAEWGERHGIIRISAPHEELWLMLALLGS